MDGGRLFGCGMEKNPVSGIRFHGSMECGLERNKSISHCRVGEEMIFKNEPIRRRKRR
jgi:hypothetical protein